MKNQFNESDIKILSYFIAFVKLECDTYALSKMTLNDFMKITDYVSIKGKLDLGDLPKKDRQYILIPSKKEKYDHYYNEKLEYLMFNITYKEEKEPIEIKKEPIEIKKVSFIDNLKKCINKVDWKKYGL